MTTNDVDLELRSFKVHAPAQTALREVLNSLQPREMDVFYAIRSRVKSVKKIIEKTNRKRNSGRPTYSPEALTDVVGIRVVTLFREDVIEALKVFLRMIRHEDVYSALSPFVKGELKEKIIYTTASVGDPEAITSRLRSVFESFNFPLKDSEVMQVETGYSSIHLIAFCSVRHDEEIAKVPIEIQIRNVFEDAWGEIDTSFAILQTGTSQHQQRVSSRVGNRISTFSSRLLTVALSMPASSRIRQLMRGRHQISILLCRWMTSKKPCSRLATRPLISFPLLS